MKKQKALNTDDSITNLLPGGFLQILYDDSFTILFANPLFYKTIGITQKKLSNKYENKIKNILLKADWNYIYNSVKKAKETDEPVFQISMTIPTLQKHGGMYLIRGSFSEKHSNTIINCIMLDVSDEFFARKAQHRAENFLNVALANSNVLVWEWDFISSKCVFDRNSSLASYKPTAFDNIPESFISAGYVADDSISVFRKLHERVKSSLKPQQEDIHLFVNGIEAWVQISYTPYSQNTEKPKSAIGISRIITRQKQAEIKYSQSMRYQLVEMDAVLAYCEYNVTQNKFISFKSNTNDTILPVVTETIDFRSVIQWLIELLIAKVPYEEDIIKIQSAFTEEEFLKILDAKEKVIKVEYRRKTNDGEIIWVKVTCRFVRNLASNEMTMFGILKNIDKQKKVELSLRSRAERDLVSGFYNQETVTGVISEMIQNGIESNICCAMLIFDIDNYLNLMNTSGYQDCRTVLKELAQLIDAKFSGAKITGRIEGDEFLVFLYENQSKENVLKIAEDIRITISMPYLFPLFSVTVSCGVVFLTVEGQTYDSILKKARVALGIAKTRGKNRIEVFGETNNSHVYDNQDLNAQISENDNRLKDEKPSFSEKEQKELLLKMCFTLSEIDSFDSSMKTVLKSIASYFSSKKVFLLEFDSNLKTIEKYSYFDVSIQNIEKTDKKIDEINNAVSKSWLMALKNTRSMIVADITILKGTFPKEYKVLKEWNVESFILAAITKDGIVSGYIVAFNPKWNLRDKQFFQIIGYYLSNELEKHRIIERQRYLRDHDSLTGFYSRDVFETYKNRFSGDSLISMGFIYCQIQDLRKLNHQYGHVYGDSLILFVTDMIKSFFSKNRTFRYTGGSFVILVENIQRDAFYTKIFKFKNECGKSFENLIFVGYSWSDYELNLDELFLHSSEKLLHDKQILERNAILKKDIHHEKAYKILLQELYGDRYTVFLQPKADCLSGTISGAEALIRYYDEEGKLVRPDSFIPFFESEGLVSEIDFFVLNTVYKILQSWVDAGKTLFPISLNFSRATMLDDKLFERIEKIQSNYTVPRKYIEIEMTETLSNMDEDMLIRICKKIANLGYGLTLDDFGARYSNLSILTSIPFNVLKLDKTLVRDIFFNSRTKVVVQSFLVTCRNLEIRSIAEGVENQEQFDVLKQMGCDSVQGYLINKPIPFDEFEKKYIK
ncbi:MAG: hypothetical protein BKP49_02320 [Treponema sp. CETP13]|nr:MAG: hypothetical protein BKP49_02320 [Treponema sp. CETP13]